MVALSKKVTPEKPDLTNLKHSQTLAIHSFSKLVDQFIEQHGFKCTTDGRKEHAGEKETAIIIPGALCNENGENEESGFFVYLIDEDGKCFHRMFDIRTHTDFVKQILSKGCLNYYEK